VNLSVKHIVLCGNWLPVLLSTKRIVNGMLASGK